MSNENWAEALLEIREALTISFGEKFLDLYCQSWQYRFRCDVLLLRFSETLKAEDAERGVCMAKEILKARRLENIVAIDHGEWL